MALRSFRLHTFSMVKVELVDGWSTCITCLKRSRLGAARFPERRGVDRSRGRSRRVGARRPDHFEIPQGAFSEAVKFQLPEGPAATFQTMAPAGETVVSDFALRVVDSATGQLVGTFLKPVTFTLKQSGVSSASVYDNVTPPGQVVPNPVPAKITGDVLTHPITAAMVGWVVLSRATTVPGATSPTTGIPVLPVVGLGAVLIAAGVLLVRHARAGA